MPRFLVDERLGRLAVHLRMLGYDAAGGSRADAEKRALRAQADAPRDGAQKGSPGAGSATMDPGRAHDDHLLARARHDGRILVTRDRELAARAGPHGFLVASNDPDEQLLALAQALHLTPTEEAFLSRCTVCNEPLDDVAPGEVAEALPPDVRGAAGPVARCPSCGRVYWDGTHVDSMRRLRRRLLDGLEDTES